VRASEAKREVGINEEKMRETEGRGNEKRAVISKKRRGEGSRGESRKAEGRRGQEEG
jgi:hypothetical protein